MKLDITKGIQRKGIDVPFDLEDNWGEDHWNGDTIAYVGPVSLPALICSPMRPYLCAVRPAP